MRVPKLLRRLRLHLPHTDGTTSAVIQTPPGMLPAQQLAAIEMLQLFGIGGQAAEVIAGHVDPGAGADAAWDCEVLWLPAGADWRVSSCSRGTSSLEDPSPPA